LSPIYIYLLYSVSCHLSCSNIGFQEEQDWYFIFLWRVTKIHPRNSRASPNRLPPSLKEDWLPKMTRLHHGGGIITYWEPDCSPQVMTVITTSRTPFRTRTEMMTKLDTLCLGLFNYAFLSCLDPVLPLFKSKAHLCTPWKWAKCLLPSSCVPNNKSFFALQIYLSVLGPVTGLDILKP
jgi:hypothetical protein